jgi:hypothetical protein
LGGNTDVSEIFPRKNRYFPNFLLKLFCHFPTLPLGDKRRKK